MCMWGMILFLIDVIKRYGLDGYGSDFYKVVWGVVKEDIIYMIYM